MRIVAPFIEYALNPPKKPVEDEMGRYDSSAMQGEMTYIGSQEDQGSIDKNNISKNISVLDYLSAQ